MRGQRQRQFSEFQGALMPMRLQANNRCPTWNLWHQLRENFYRPAIPQLRLVGRQFELLREHLRAGTYQFDQVQVLQRFFVQVHKAVVDRREMTRKSALRDSLAMMPSASSSPITECSG